MKIKHLFLTILAACLFCTELTAVPPVLKTVEQGKDMRPDADGFLRLAWDCYYKGIVFSESDRFQLAQEALLRAERMASEIRDYALMGRVYEALGTLYRKHKDTLKANAYQRQYTVYLDSVYKNEKVAELVDQSQKYERERMIAQLRQVNMESKLTGVLLGVGMSAFLLSVGWMWKKRKRLLPQREICKADAATQSLHALTDSSLYCKLMPLMGKKREVKDFEMNGVQEQDWQDFFQQMDFAYARFVTRLEEEYQLKNDYLKLACLILLNIQPCNAKNIYYRTSSAVTNKKSKLADKLGVRMDELEPFMKAFANGENKGATFKTERK